MTMKTYTNLKILFPYIKKSKRYLIFGIMGILIASAIVAPVPYFIGNVLDVLVKENVTFSDIKNTLILISAIYFVKFLINMSYQQSFAKLQQKIVNEIRLDMVKSILDAPLSFINKREKGYILSRIGEVQQIGAIFSPTIITNFVGIFEMLFCFMMMMSINVKLTLVALIIVPGYFALSKSISKKITKCTVKMQEDSANLNADMFETLNGIEEVKLLNGKQIQLKKIYFKIQTLIRSAIKQSFSMIVFIQSISFVSDLVTVGILALAGIFIINGEITIGVYTAFSLYIGKLLGVTQSVGTFEITIKPVCATIERAKEFLFSDLETHKGSKKLNENIHEVFFENVSFGYKGNNIVINEMTQKFIEGDKVLLLGENGSGKTTFVKLLVGLYEPVKGKIFINNQSIDKLCKDDIRKREQIYKEALKMTENLKDESRMVQKIEQNINGINYGAVTGINEGIVENVISRNNESIQNDIKQAKEKIANIKELNSDMKDFLYGLLDEAGVSILKDDNKLKGECVNKFKGFIAGVGKVSTAILSVLGSVASIASFFGI